MLPLDSGDLLSWVCDQSFGTRHATLFDPANQSPEEAAKKAQTAVEAGSSMILVGGSTDTDDDSVHATVSAIQEVLELRLWASTQDTTGSEDDWRIPVILFPGGAHALSSSADGILFMMLMNSKDPRFLIDEQVKAAPWLHAHGIEMLPTGYLICNPGGKAGEIGRAELLNEEDEILAYALCAQGYGMRIVYLEAGSGAHTPVDTSLISAASNQGMCLFVGGGIRTQQQARKAKEAGASWLVTGTLVEEQDNHGNLYKILTELITGLR